MNTAEGLPCISSAADDTCSLVTDSFYHGANHANPWAPEVKEVLNWSQEIRVEQAGTLICRGAQNRKLKSHENTITRLSDKKSAPAMF